MTAPADYRRHAALGGLTDAELQAFAALPGTGEPVPFAHLVTRTHLTAAELRAALDSLQTRRMASHLTDGRGWWRTTGYLHLDLGQHYAAGRFWTECECGSAWAGDIPDDADAAQAFHREDASALAEVSR